MGKHVRQCDMKVMKMAMLKHEETFRQQVHELHRLYRIQTQLMAGDLSTRRQPRRPGNKQPRRVLNLQLPPDQYLVGAEDEDDEELELELTLAVGGRISSAPKKRGDAKYSAGGRFASGCSGGTSLSSSSPPSSVGYSWGAAGVALHGYAPLRRPCQRTMAFDLGMEEAMKKHQSPWQLVQCQYPSLRMT